MPEEREDVEAKLEQGTTSDAPQQKEKRQEQFVCWLKSRPINKIVGSTLIIEALWVALFWFMPQVLHWWSWNPAVSAEHFAQFYFAWGLGFLSLGYIVLILWPIFRKDDDPRWFHARILSSGIVGGSYAFLLPVVMSLPEGSVNSGGAAALRQAILLATGGLIGLIALGETRRKNDNDREAAENLRIHQQDTLDQQKEQFEKQLEKQQKQFEANAFKERKAERRERYTKAVEQLGDEKAPIRMGGVYTLVGLVDEWLEEESIRKYEDRLKEGQVIINNLCAYIRSPFTLTTRYDELSEDSPTSDGVYKDNQQEFYKDKAEFKAETDVRRSIIKEIHDRLQGPEENTPGTWSDFEYDFSGSTFFYPVDLINSYYKKSVTFRGSTYQDWAVFGGSTYKGWADFSGSTYEKDVTFSTTISRSIYLSRAVFGGSTYKGWADFSGSTYEKDVIFSVPFARSTYKGEANFSKSIYLGLAEFSGSIYEKDVIFSTSGFTPTDWDEDDLNGSTYKGKANFSNSIYKGLANFSDSTYEKEVIFSAPFARSTYKGEADFRSSTYQDKAVFSGSIYQVLTYFSGSIFYSETYFSKGGYSNSPSCFTNCAPQFYDKKNRKNTLFGSHNNDFTVDIDKGYPIDLDSKSIPLNCKFLTSEQKEYLEGKLQEIEKIQNKLLEAKDPKEKVEISKKLRSFTEKLHEWREEATTVKVEDVAAEDTES